MYESTLNVLHWPCMNRHILICFFFCLLFYEYCEFGHASSPFFHILSFTYIAGKYAIFDAASTFLNE